MNELIETIFANFTVDEVAIPVKYLRYKGKENTYVTYIQTYKNQSYSGDDELLGYVELYDFDVYSKGNYSKVIEQIKEKLLANGFMWQPSLDSSDMYEDETGFYHKTICFATFQNLNKEENQDG